MLNKTEQCLCIIITVLWGSAEIYKKQIMTPSVPSKWRHCRLAGEELVTGRMFPVGFKDRIMKITNCLRPSLKLGD